MATKKTVDAEVLTENAAPAVNAAEEAGTYDPWNDMKEILVPKKPRGEDQQYYICVNDRRFLIPANGKMQKMPMPIAEALLNSVQAEYDAEDFAEKIPNRSGETPAEHPI